MFTKNIPLWLSLMLALLPPLYILLIVAHLLRPKMIRDKSQQVWVAEPLQGHTPMRVDLCARPHCTSPAS